jgi:holo-[acyl-carrier protein] synthase
MILGIGSDVLEVARMEAELSRREASFRDNVFTAGEIAYCEAKHAPARHYAARFAAKEAVLKALSAAGGPGLNWREIEISSQASGRPCVRLHGAVRQLADASGVGAIHISLTHTDALAAAAAVLESRPDGAGGEEVNR